LTHYIVLVVCYINKKGANNKMPGKQIVFKKIKQKMEDPLNFDENFNFSITPFLIIIGSTRKTYYNVYMYFKFLSELPTKEGYLSHSISADSLEEKNKEFQEGHNIFIKKVNESILELTKIKSEKVVFKNDFYILPNKKYRAIVTIEKIPVDEIDKIEIKEKESIVDKYINRILTAVQCAGDRGITLTNLIRKTQTLEKHVRLNMLTDLEGRGFIILKKTKTSAKDIRTYFWNFDKEHE